MVPRFAAGHRVHASTRTRAPKLLSGGSVQAGRVTTIAGDWLHGTPFTTTSHDLPGPAESAPTSGAESALASGDSRRPADETETHDPEKKPDEGKAEHDQAEKKRDQAKAERDQAEMNRDKAKAERDQAKAERDQAKAERDQAETKRDQAIKKRDQAIKKWEDTGSKPDGIFYDLLNGAQATLNGAQTALDNREKALDNREKALASAQDILDGITRAMTTKGGAVVASALPKELREFTIIYPEGQVIRQDRLPWEHDVLAAFAARNLVTAPSTIDEATQMEIVMTTSSLIEPACTGREATIFLRKELVDKWDALEAAFRDPNSGFVRGGIAGTAGTGKTWSLNYVMRKALRAGRPLVAELRRREQGVVLIAPSGVYDPKRPNDWSCAAWSVDHAHFLPSHCALLSDRNTCFVVDCASSRRKAIGRVQAMTFTTRSKDFELTKEDVVKDGGVETETSTYSWAETQVFGDHFGIPLGCLRQKFLVCGGRPRAFNDNHWVHKMRQAVANMPAHLLQSLGDFGGTASGKDGGFEGPSTLVTADPDPEAQQQDILTNTTRCQAASPVAVAFLAAAWVDLLGDAVKVANVKVAGRIFEHYQRLQFAAGADMRVLQLGTPAAPTEMSLWLPPAKIITSKEGPNQNEDFYLKVQALPETPAQAQVSRPDRACDMTADYAQAEFLRFIQLIPEEERRLLLPRYDTDFHHFFQTLDESTMQRTLVVGESFSNTIPNVDGADYKDRAFSMKSGHLDNASLSGKHLNTYLRRFGLVHPENSTGRRLQLYWTVPTSNFDSLAKQAKSGTPIGRRRINGGSQKVLRECFDEWVMCTPSTLSLQNIVALANAVFKGKS